MEKMAEEWSKMNMLLLLMCLWLSSFTCVSANVSGCGGFVRIGPEFASLDRSKLSVGLFTQPHLSLKESVDFSPSNGYFFVPIYDDSKDKKYVLKVIAPKGWTTTPEEVLVNTEKDGEMCADDVVFDFVGFAVHGSLRTEEGHQGPRDRGVTLKKQATGEVVQRSRTDASGSFVFLGVVPGQYQVQMERHESGHRCDVVVDSDNVHCQPFVLTGVEVEGVVKDQLMQPLVDVNIELRPVSTSVEKKISRVASDEKGRFAFSNVSRGEYQVEIAHQSMTFEPAKHKIVVEDNNILDIEFSLKAFGVQGKIENMPKQTAKQLKIKVENLDPNVASRGEAIEVQVEEGVYKLKDVNLGEYSMVAEAPKMEFEPLVISIKNVLSPMPVLTPRAFEVLFKVEINDDMDLEDMKVKCDSKVDKKESFSVGLENLKQEDKKKWARAIIMLPRDQAFLCQVIVENEASKSWVIEPQNVEVVVTSPMEGINFGLKRFTLKGKVSCLDKCMEKKGTTLSVELRSSKGMLESEKLGKGHQKGKSNELEFQFDELLPGHYETLISDSSSIMCFAEQKIEIDLQDNAKLPIHFQHVGYKMQVLASHSTELFLTDLKSKKDQHRLKIERGASQHCIKTSSQLELSTKCCQNFDFLPSNQFTPGKDIDIQLRLRSLSIEGSISSDEPINKLSVDVRTTAENENDKDDSHTDVVRQQREVKLSQYKSGRYIFGFEAEEGEELVIEAHSEAHFFHPIRKVVLLQGICDDLNLDFEAKRGVFFEGAIQPAVENVLVQLLEDGDEEIVSEALSDDAGYYKLGPLRALPDKMALRAGREGYFFEETNANGVFKAQKYAAIHVVIKPTSTSSSTELTLPSAVVSVSGGSYRDQAMTDSKGLLSFSKLSAGEYFLQAFVKEWELRPKSQLVQLKEGEEQTIVFEARRVAFAVNTKVVALNGDPLSDVVVVAKGLPNSNCSELKEDSTSQTDGKVRLGGLKAYCSYTLEIPEAQTVVGKAVVLKMGEFDQVLKEPIKVVMQTHANLMDMAIIFEDEDKDVIMKEEKSKSKDQRVFHMELTHSSNGYVRRFDLSPSQSKIHVIQDVPMTNESGSGFYTLSDNFGNKRIVQAHSPFMTLHWESSNEKNKSGDNDGLDAFPLRKLIVALGAVSVVALIALRFNYLKAWVLKSKND